jgi:hypothetical protein
VASQKNVENRILYHALSLSRCRLQQAENEPKRSEKFISLPKMRRESLLRKKEKSEKRKMYHQA